MSPESRTLIVVLIIVGLMASCCLCVPIGFAVAVPAIASIQKAAEQAQAKQMAEQAHKRMAGQQARRLPPPVIIPSPAPLPPIIPQPRSLPPESSPPFIELPPAPKVVRPRPPSDWPKLPRQEKPGFDALSESQRRVIYRSATIHDRLRDSMQKQMDRQRQSGLDTSLLERMQRDRDARQQEELVRLRERFKVSQPELEQIIAEGKGKGW